MHLKEVNVTRIINTVSKHRLSAKFVAGLALLATISTGTFAGSASAQDRWGHRGNDWNGGYYRAPPVVYGSPYATTYYGAPYYAPPVVYGPPGFSIQFR